jgi:RNA polymerase sigma-54 factor
VQIQKPVLVQEQRLKMNPQLYQSIQMMALPIIDLRFRIQQELEANPALEVLEDRSTLSLEEERTKADNTEPPEEYEYFEDSSDSGFTRSYDDSAGDTKRMFMEGALSRPESLHEHLLWQLRVQPITQELYDLGELLIRNLDENGFHREDPYTMVAPERRDQMDSMMEMIRTFEPVGTCVNDYRESLQVQAQIDGLAPEGTLEILDKYLDLLEKGKHTEIAKKTKLDEEDVEMCLEYIRTLTPFPGRLYSTEEPRYVIPDLMVKLKDGQFFIIMNDEEIPVLGVNPFFTEVVRNTKRGSEKELKQFVNTRLKDARWFIHSIHQRNQTLLKVSRAIVEFQRDFFVRGPKYLVPLTLKDIAGEVGVHEATVSRITNGKYVQTEWGIFELKYFFSNSISGSGSTGSRFSKEGVKQIIKEILENEGAKEHLSDRKISEILEKRGIKLARRTVAKYRKELDISSSYER